MVDNLKEKADEMEKVRQEVPAEAPVTPKETGSKPKASTLIDGANAAAERLEEANKKMEELITRQEEATAKAMLGSKVDRGQVPEVTQEEKDKEAVDKMLNTYS